MPRIVDQQDQRAEAPVNGVEREIPCVDGGVFEQPPGITPHIAQALRQGQTA